MILLGLELVEVHKGFTVGQQPAAVVDSGMVQFIQFLHDGGNVGLVYRRELRRGGVLYPYYFHNLMSVSFCCTFYVIRCTLLLMRFKRITYNVPRITSPRANKGSLSIPMLMPVNVTYWRVFCGRIYVVRFT